VPHRRAILELARHGGRDRGAIVFVFTPVFGIVLGDNKKNKTRTSINNCLISIYKLKLKI
jgi:hypothetical protein